MAYKKQRTVKFLNLNVDHEYLQFRNVDVGMDESRTFVIIDGEDKDGNPASEYYAVSRIEHMCIVRNKGGQDIEP